MKIRRLLATVLALAVGGGFTLAVVPAPLPRLRPVTVKTPVPPPLPGVVAPAFAVSYDGHLIAGRRVTTLRPTASTIKVLTALAVLREGLPLAQRIVVTAGEAAAARAGQSLGHGELPLVAGETLTVGDLLVAMLLPSADDAADLLAETSPGGKQGLLRRMQSIAATLRLGLPPLADPSGLSPLDRLSPLGEVRLGWAALDNATLAGIVSTATAELSQGQSVLSLNRLLGSYPGAIGVKTGETVPAGYVLLFAARRAGTVVGVVMGEPSDARRFRDARRLLDWAFAWSRGHTLPAGSRAGSVAWPGGFVQRLRTAAPLSTPSGGVLRLHLVSPRLLARGGKVGYASLGGHRVAILASPAPLWLRLWTLAPFASGRGPRL